MGKQHQRQLSSKDKIKIAERERDKIRSSVLKVFCKQVHSSSDSGAILARKEPIKQSQTPDVGPKQVTSNSSMSDKSDILPAKRHKRRKVKHKSKIKENKARDVKTHIKMAHENGYALRSNLHQEANISRKDVSRITTNRLTKRIGLFNQGKKSSTVAREISVPDNVKKKTEEDLQKILQCSDEEDRPSYIALRNSPVKKIPVDIKKPCPSTETQRSYCHDKGYKSGGSTTHSVTPATPRGRSIPSSTSSTSDKSCQSDDIESLPKKPPYTEVAKQFMRSLKPRRIFPGRSLLEETKEYLQKLMRQNAPRSATPTPKLCNLSKRSLTQRLQSAEQLESEKLAQKQTATLGGIQQNCLSAAGPVSSHVPQQYLIQQMPKCPQEKWKLNHNFYQLSHANVCNKENLSFPSLVKYGKNTEKASSNTTNMTVKQDMQPDKKLRTRYSSQSIKEAQEHFQTLSTDVPSSDDINSVSSNVNDGRILLQFNDEMAEKAKVTEELRNAFRQTLWMEEGITTAGSSLFHSQHSFSSSQSSGYHGSQIIAQIKDNTIIPSNNQKVIAEYILPSRQISKFSGSDFVTNVINRSGHILNTQSESMDILEYLDTGVENSNSTSNVLMTTMGEKTIPWAINELPPLKKPSLDTPSPPDDLFRKFSH